MQKPRFYSFDERMAFAEGHAPSVQAVAAIIKNRIPGCIEIERADVDNDKDGTDYFIYRHGNEALRLDLKLRDEDWAPRGYDDLALETWSVIPNGANGKVGWTRDETKNSDFILWFWRDTGRFFLVNFPALCSVFSRFWQVWARQYKTAIQQSATWQSQCVYVPREVVVKKLMQWQHSNLEHLK